MPTVNGGFWDTGVALGLMPGVSYAQARADRQADLQYNIALADINKKQLQEKQDAEQKIAAKFSALKSMGFERPDQERLNFLIDDVRSKLTSKIMDKYNGDVRKYMMYEGNTDLEVVTNDILSNPVLQSAIQNKYNFGQYGIDLKEGKDYQRRVSYKLTDGTEKNGVTFSEALNDYYAYKTDKLPYSGAFAKPKGIYEFFQSQIHPDPGKRYGVVDENGNHAAPSVSYQEAFDYLVGNKDNPMKPEDAKELLDREYNMMAPSLKWKTDDWQKWLLENEKFSFMKAMEIDKSKDRKTGLALKAAAIAATAANKANTGQTVNKSDIFFDKSWKGSKPGMGSGPSMGMIPDVLKTKGIMLEKEKGKQIISGKADKVFSTTNPKNAVDLSPYDHKIVSVDETKKYSDGRNVFVKVKIEMIDDDMEKAGMLTDKWFGKDQPKNNFTSSRKGGFRQLFTTNKIRTVDVFIPIDDNADSRYMIDAFTSNPTKEDNATLSKNINLGLIDGLDMPDFTTEE